MTTMTARAECLPRSANGTLMPPREPCGGVAAGRDVPKATPLTLGFGLERAKGIEPS